MSSTTAHARKQVFTATDGYHRVVQRGPIRVPLTGARVIHVSAGEEGGEGHVKKTAGRVSFDVEKDRLRIPLFTDPRFIVRQRNA